VVVVFESELNVYSQVENFVSSFSYDLNSECVVTRLKYLYVSVVSLMVKNVADGTIPCVVLNQG
jgi:hypothetical protein